MCVAGGILPQIFFPKYLVKSICSLKYWTLWCKVAILFFPMVYLKHNFNGDGCFHSKTALLLCKCSVPDGLFTYCCWKFYNGVMIIGKFMSVSRSRDYFEKEKRFRKCLVSSLSGTGYNHDLGWAPAFSLWAIVMRPKLKLDRACAKAGNEEKERKWINSKFNTSFVSTFNI